MYLIFMQRLANIAPQDIIITIIEMQFNPPKDVLIDVMIFMIIVHPFMYCAIFNSSFDFVIICTR